VPLVGKVKKEHETTLHSQGEAEGHARGGKETKSKRKGKKRKINTSKVKQRAMPAASQLEKNKGKKRKAKEKKRKGKRNKIITSKVKKRAMPAASQLKTRCVGFEGPGASTNRRGR
jgi:hypothetical protein